MLSDLIGRCEHKLPLASQHIGITQQVVTPTSGSSQYTGPQFYTQQLLRLRTRRFFPSDGRSTRQYSLCRQVLATQAELAMQGSWL